jgi:predicted RNA binding protein with dsRBD fold (UPF0201 family)
VFLHDAGADFPADWVKQSAQIGGTSATVRTDKAGEAELLAWLAPETAPAAKSAARR